MTETEQTPFGIAFWDAFNELQRIKQQQRDLTIRKASTHQNG